jgi:hypothetical protein
MGFSVTTANIPMLWAKAEDATMVFRREFLQLIAGATPAIAFRPGAAQETLRRVRVATGLLATWQSTAWLGAEAGGRHNRLVNRSWMTTKHTNENPISNAIPSMDALLTRKMSSGT